MKPCKVLSEIDFKGESSYEKYIKKCKEIFRRNIFNQDFSLMGYPIRLLYDDNFEKCFDKFSIGDEKYHNKTHKYDKERLRRLQWIYDLLKNYKDCKKSKICNDYIISMYNHNGIASAAIFCETHSFGIFFEDNINSDDPHFLMKSAYVTYHENTVNKIKNNRI